MGRDFSIGCSDSTLKGVSYIMFQMVKNVSQIADDVDIDNIPHEDKYISIEQLAMIIQSLKDDLVTVYYDNDLKTKFVEGYKFYDNDTFETVFENCEMARYLFVNALVDSILNKEDKVYWNYA
jgi:hypothetical protein